MLNAPNSRVLTANVPAAGAAVVQDQVIGESPVTGQVTEVVIYPEANVVANAVNFRTFRLINKGLDGNGAVVVASFATDLPTTDDLADFDEKGIPLSVVAGAVNVAEGDILAMDETVAAAGVAHSGYGVKVTVSKVVSS